MQSFMVPPNPGMKASTVFAFNRGAIVERLDAGMMVTEVYRELTAFLEKAGHKNVPHQQSLYSWIKRQGGKAAARPGPATESAAGEKLSPAAPSPSAKKGEKKVFDSHRQHDVDDLV